MNYFLADGQQRRGPYPIEALVRHGLRPTTLVWRSGMSDWRQARDLPELLPVLRSAGYDAAPPPPPPPPTGGGHVHPTPMIGSWTSSEINSRKIAAGVCGIVLGGLGVHKFVLGMVGPGLILLLVTFFTCGIGAAVTSVIGLIEGIVYLTKSDEEFYQRYVVAKQAWF